MKSPATKALLWLLVPSFTVPLLAMVISWLLLGTTSPLHGEGNEELVKHPVEMVWILFNFPAFIVCWNTFGWHDNQNALFLCIFIQWFVIGLFLGIPLGALRFAIRPKSN